MDTEESKVYLKILIFSLLLAILIVGFIVSFFKQQQRFNKQKIKAEINTSEQEKKKLASDLHDDLGPILATIKIYVNSLSVDEIKDKNLIQNVNKYIDLGITRVKVMANGLMPNTLQRKGLIKALDEYVINIRTYVNFDIDFFCNDYNLPISDEAELNLYRIIQEIITNTIKHSKATLLKIVIEKRESNLLILLEDNGEGFAYTDHNYVSVGYGISNIKSRVEMLKGTYAIFSKPQEGTKYQISIPLKKYGIS